MQIQVATLCASATDYGGRLCLLGAFDTLFARKFPVVHPHCALALRLCFFAEDEGSIQFSIRLLDADGQPVTPPIEPKVDVQLGNDASFMTRNLVLNLQGLSFPTAGEYALQIVCDGRSAAEIPLRLVEVAEGQ
jgi:hypothetical protein